MARKLSILEVLLIIFNIVVLAVDILLLLLVLEDSPGKDNGGCYAWRVGKASPLWMPEIPFYSFLTIPYQAI